MKQRILSLKEFRPQVIYSLLFLVFSYQGKATALYNPCDTSIHIQAITDGFGLCTAPAFQLKAPDKIGLCSPASINLTASTIPLAFLTDLSNNPIASLPFSLQPLDQLHVLADLETGAYSLTFERIDCAGNSTICTQTVLIAPTMICNDLIHTSLNDNCQLELLADMVLEAQCAGNEHYILSVDGLPTPTIHETGTYTVRVEYAPAFDHDGDSTTPLVNVPSGIYCWGEVLVEDKSGPICILETNQVTAFCNEANADIIPTFIDCTGLGTDTIQYDTPLGACSILDGQNYSSPTNNGNGYITEFLPSQIPFPIEVPIGFDLDHVNIRIWQTNDVLGNVSTSCKQYIYHWRPTTIINPIEIVELDCASGTDAFSLAAADPQYVPSYLNPLYGLDTTTTNDFPFTKVDNQGQSQYLSILPDSHEACQYTVAYEDLPIEGLCGNTYKLVRKWHILNWCTGAVTTADQIIKLIDSTPPSIVCPSDISVAIPTNNCSATVTIPAVMVSDDCADTDALVITNVWAFGSDSLAYTNVPAGIHQLTFVATDACGNSNFCSIEVRVYDPIHPVAICEQNTQIAIPLINTAMICADDIDSNSYDNCELVSKEVSLMGTDEFSPCLELTCDNVGDTLQVILQVTDINGLSNQCMVFVEVVDKLAPIITCPDDLTIACTQTSLDTSFTGVPMVEDNCSINLEYTDVNDFNVCNTGTITRTWMATDDFMNVASCVQIITIEDRTPPIIQFQNDTTLFICQQLDDDFGEPSIEDDCGLYGTSVLDVVLIDEPCFQKIQRTWHVLGWCDDTDISQTMTLQVHIDLNAPIFENTPQDTTLNCDETIPSDAPDISDACDMDLTIEFEETETNGNCPYERIITKTWNATDACGNNSSHQQTITIVDNVAPVLINPIPDIAVECDEVIPEIIPLFVDNCTPDNLIRVSMTEDTITGNCPFQMQIMRTWVAVDECSNSTVLVQAIDINDTTAPVFHNVPLDTILYCGNPVPTDNPFISDNCTEGLSFEINDTVVPGDCSQESVITRTWTTSDDCGNMASATQVISIIDDTPPIFINQPVDMTIACNEMLPFFIPLVLDECGTDFSLIESRDTTGTSCDLTITRTWVAADACGNTTSTVQVVSVQDNMPPTLVGTLNVDIDLVDEFSANLTLPTPVAIDDCTTNLDITIMIDFYSDGIFIDYGFTRNDTTFVNGNPSGLYPIGRHTITFSTSDACGNVDTATSTIMITYEDGNDEECPPTNNCTGLTINVDQNGNAFALINQLVNLTPQQETCTNIIFEVGSSASNTVLPIDSIFFDCTDIGTNTYMLETIYPSGDSDLCTNVLQVVDTANICGTSPKSPIVSGKVFTQNYKTLASTEIILNDNPETMVKTNENGLYIFPTIEAGSTCSIQPHSPTDYLNGASTFDLILIQQHILGIQTIHSPYQLIAADINNSGTISTLDIVDLRQTILYNQTAFSNNTSWRYLDASYEFINPTNPFEEVMTEKRYCKNITSSHLNVDFVAIKIGDIDGTNLNDITNTASERNDMVLDMILESQFVETEGINVIHTYVDNYVDNFSSLVGVQFTLEWDPNTIELIEVMAEGQFSSYNLGTHFINKGILTCSWNGTESLIPFENLFSLKVKTKESISLKDAFRLTSKYTPAAAFEEAGQVHEINLNPMHTLLESSNVLSSTTTTTTSDNFVLQQNHPNPFNKQTIIEFAVSEATPTQFQLLDLTGQVLVNQIIDADRGLNQITIDRNQLLDAGIYIYQMSNKFGVKSKKMMCLD